MNPLDFQSLAAILAKLNTAAGAKSAVSRAYYAAFLVGAETLRNLGFLVSKGGAAHGEVARCLCNSGDAQTTTAAQRLSELHGARIRADYQLHRSEVENTADVNRNLKIAREIIATFDRIPTSLQRVAIQSAIAGWRKSNGYP